MIANLQRKAKLYSVAIDRACFNARVTARRGPIACRRRTVDVGLAQLAMHSAREMCGAEDPGLMVRALGAFFVS